VDNGNVYIDRLGGGAIQGGLIVQGFDFVETSSAGVPSNTKSPEADGKKLIADLPFEAFDVTGKRVSRTAALERLKAGGLVIIAGDNRFPDPAYLKSFRDDILVIASSELVLPPGVPNPYDGVASTGTIPKPNAVRPPPAQRAVPQLRLNRAAIKQLQIKK
jgi:hypothetical protein